MSDDFEAFLRSGLADRADSAPSYDDPGLADAAIAGAGRIRRRRRVASAAGGAGLLVLGAATFVWQPWIAPDDKGDDTIAADTSTTEAQNELDMEFVVEGDDGYSVLNQDGDSIVLSEAEPDAVYRLSDAYLAENASELWTVNFDGETVDAFQKPSADETYTKINSVGEQFAMVTPAEDYSVEEYTLVDVTLADPATEAEAADPVNFTTSYDITLEDWNDTTAVFTGDLYSTTAGETSTFYFNDQYSWGMESVGAAGFESAVFVDISDPSVVCVADLEPLEGVAVESEACGTADDSVLQDELVAASTDTDASLKEISQNVAGPMDEQSVYLEGMDLGEYENQYYDADYNWADPANRWQMAGSIGDPTWLLLDKADGENELSELAPPSGAIMPVLSYT